MWAIVKWERLIKRSDTSTNPENMVKIGLVDSKIFCLEVEPLKI